VPIGEIRWAILGIFVVTYVAITARRLSFLPIGRPALTLVGACALVAVGALDPKAGLSADDAIGAIDAHTILLLFGMMVLAAGLDEGGFFPLAVDAIAMRSRSRAGALWAMTIGCGLFSALAVNDSVCLLATPLAVLLADRVAVPRVAFLLAVATGSNTGSALTLGGNPQNMLVGRLSAIGYRTYFLHVAPGVLLALVANAAILHFFFRRPLAAPMPTVTERDSIAPRRPHDARLLTVAAATLAGVTVANALGASLAWTAVTGAAIVLVAAGERAPKLLERVDWSVLVFFASLFIVIAAVQRTGVPAVLLAGLDVPRGSGESVLPLTGVLVAGSQIVSNVPLILLLEPWLRRFANPTLAWTLAAVVTTLAGNLTVMGSVANVIVIEQAKAQNELGFWQHFRVGAPIACVTIAIAVTVIYFTF
jgi:Na+/H+ antiporter NhaD/arsenite permease-like protein